MQRSSLFIIPLITMTTCLFSSENARNNQWWEVWQKKGQKALEKEQNLYEADGYEVISQHHWEAMLQALLLKADVPANPSVCEFGCGAGALLEQVQVLEPNAKLYGFDYSPSLIELAQKRHPEGHFWVQSVSEPLPEKIANKRFDLTVCHGVFMYINSHDDAKKALDNMLSITKEGGKMVLGDISDLDKKELAMKLRGETHASNTSQVAPDLKLDHLYVSRQLFTDFARENNLQLQFVEYADIDPQGHYPNGQYRLCLIMTKPANAEASV